MIVKNISQTIQEALRAKERAFSRKNPALDGEQFAEGSVKFEDLATRTVFARMISNKTGTNQRIIQGGELFNKTQFGFDSDGGGLYQSFEYSEIQEL